MSAGVRGALLGLLAFALFASHDALIKYLGGVGYSVFQIIFFSVLFGFPLVLALLAFDKTRASLRPVHPWWIALRSGLSVIAGANIFYAFSVLPFAETYAILFAGPIFITALSVPMLGEAVGRWRWAAVIVGFVGVLVVLQPGVSPVSPGHLAALIGTLAAAVIMITVRKVGRDERMAVLLLYPMFANIVVMGGALLVVYRPMPLIDLGASALMAVLGLLAMMSLVSAYRITIVSIVAPMQYSQILWAVVFGYVFFAEIPRQSVGLGAAIIIASGVFILWRESQVLRRN
jgi:drug/metabolite transporter (DMT)-like permease